MLSRRAASMAAELTSPSSVLVPSSPDESRRIEVSDQERPGFLQALAGGCGVTVLTEDYFMRVRQGAARSYFNLGSIKKEAGQLADEIAAFLEVDGNTLNEALIRYSETHRNKALRELKEPKPAVEVLTVGALIEAYLAISGHLSWATRRNNTQALRHFAAGVWELPKLGVDQTSIKPFTLVGHLSDAAWLDNDRAAVLGADTQVQIFDRRNGKLSGDFRFSAAITRVASHSPDGKFLLLGTATGPQILDVDTGAKTMIKSPMAVALGYRRRPFSTAPQG